MWRRRVSFSEKLDPGSVAWSRRETCITSHERSGKGLSEREIRSVVGRQGMAQLPDTEEEHIMRIAVEGQVGQIIQRRLGTLRSHVPGRGVSS